MAERTLPPIVLLLGARRSGTTLLRTVLDGHPGLAVHPDEPQFIRDVWREFGDPIWNVPAAVEMVCRHRLTPPQVTCTALAAQLDMPPVGVQALVSAYLAVWQGDAQRARPVVLKDPYFIFHIGQLEALFPGARYLHIVRDPRANVASQRARWPQASIVECTQWWLDALAAGDRLQRTRPPRTLQLRYEDLVTTPAATLQSVCAFLGVPYTDDLLTFRLDTTGYMADGQPLAERFTGFDPSRLTRWRQQLTPLEVAMIETLCAPAMQTHNYPLQQPAVSPTQLTRTLRRQQARYAALRAGRAVKDGGRALRRRLRQAVRR